jgi:hypothetical protein
VDLEASIVVKEEHAMKLTLDIGRGWRLATLGAMVGGAFTMASIVASDAAVTFPNSALGVTVNGIGDPLTVNDKIFYNFTCKIATQAGSVSLPLGCSGVSVSPLPIGADGIDNTADNYPGITIGGSFTATTTSTNGASLDFVIEYDATVDPVLGKHNYISDVHMAFDLDAINAAFTQVGETVTSTGFVGPVAVTVYDNDPLDTKFTQQSQTILLPNPVKTIHVKKDIKLDAFCNAPTPDDPCASPFGIASGSIIEQRLSQTEMPEPATLGLLGAGLFGLGWLSRRRRMAA